MIATIVAGTALNDSQSTESWRAWAEALGQIERRRYDEAVQSRGVDPSRISHLGIAFHGKRVLVRAG